MRSSADNGCRRSSLQWNGNTVAAKPGDTVASALYRSGVRTFTYSYQYGRPRGLLCLTGSCPNCMVNVDGVPNVRSCITPARDGLSVLSQNQNVYRGFDSPAVKRFPAGSAALRVATSLRACLPAIRCGCGRRRKAWFRSRSGLRFRGKQVASAGKAACACGDSLAQEVQAHPMITTFLNCSCFGLYEGNLLGAVQIDYAGLTRRRFCIFAPVAWSSPRAPMRRSFSLPTTICRA